ncbi:arylsulfatase B [Novipirellula herctigrandis]
MLCTHSASAIDAKQPNIVILLADDLGWSDVGFHGSDIKTPNLDKLANEGVKLKQFYVQPTCSPTRIGLMTGRYPYHIGGHICVLRPYHQHGLPLDEYMLSEVMQDAGYRTAITGKWHLGLAKRSYWPTSRGFDLAYGHLGGAIDYFEHTGYGSLDWYDQDTIPLHVEGYTTDLIGNRASQIIKDHDFEAQPLFLYVPFNAPHAPLHAKPSDIANYSGVKDEKRRTYCAQVDCMDQQIGHIVQALVEKGVARNTLVFFASDNGGYGQVADNAPLRGTKGTLFEGGVRVPSFIVWPDRLTGGRSFEPPLHIVDLLPTFSGLAGGITSKCKALDGIDFWPALANDQAMPKRDIYHNVHDSKGGRGSIRSGDWKLIVTLAEKADDGMPLENPKHVALLFDIRRDPFEQQNLATNHPEIVAALWKKIKARGPDVGDAHPYTARAPKDWVAPSDWSDAPE